MEMIFSSHLSVEKNAQVAKLVQAARKALAALQSGAASWQGEGYAGNNSDDEIADLTAALVPFEGMYHK